MRSCQVSSPKSTPAIGSPGKNVPAESMYPAARSKYWRGKDLRPVLVPAVSVSIRTAGRSVSSTCMISATNLVEGHYKLTTKSPYVGEERRANLTAAILHFIHKSLYFVQFGQFAAPVPSQPEQRRRRDRQRGYQQRQPAHTG